MMVNTQSREGVRSAHVDVQKLKFFSHRSCDTTFSSTPNANRLGNRHKYRQSAWCTSGIS